MGRVGKPEWDEEAFTTTRPGEVGCDKRKQGTFRERQEALDRFACSL